MTRSRKRRLNRAARSVGRKARQLAPDAGGAVVGGIATLIAGPIGLLASILAVPATTWGLRELLLHTQMSKTEAERIAAVTSEAATILEERLNNGATLRADWFGPDATDRKSADEAIEHLMRVAKDDPYEKKQHHYAILLANLSTAKEFDPDTVALLIRQAERLSYRQLCMLAMVFQGRSPVISNKPKEGQENKPMHVLGALKEYQDLVVDYPDNFPPDFSRIDLMLQMTGRLMEVETIDSQDIDVVFRLLEVNLPIDFIFNPDDKS